MNPKSPMPLVYDLYGNALTGHDILTMKIVRWSVGKKYIMVQAVIRKVLTKDAILETFHIGLEEFDGWMNAFQREGTSGLNLRRAVAEVRSRSE